MKVVLDTNVLVSATLSNGPPYQILELAEDGTITSVTSPGLIEETRDVLTRDRLPFTNSQADDFVEKVLSVSRVVAPETDLQVIEDDPDDDKIVECAVAANADYTISGSSSITDRSTRFRLVVETVPRRPRSRVTRSRRRRRPRLQWPR